MDSVQRMGSDKIVSIEASLSLQSAQVGLHQLHELGRNVLAEATSGSHGQKETAILMTKQTLKKFMMSPPIAADRQFLNITGGNASEFLDISPRNYPPNTMISRPGESGNRVFIVAAGWTCICRHLSNGNRQIIDTPLKGDVLDIAPFDGGGYISLNSTTDVSIFEIPGQMFRKALEGSAALGAIFFRLMVRQHAIANERLTSVCRRSAIERTAHFLLELAERLEGSGANARHGYDCPLTQHDLADLLGLTQIHVNRTLRELRERELVSFRSGHVEFIDRHKLAKLAGFDKGYLQYPSYASPQRGSAPHRPIAAARFGMF